MAHVLNAGLGSERYVDFMPPFHTACVKTNSVAQVNLVRHASKGLEVLLWPRQYAFESPYSMISLLQNVRSTTTHCLALAGADVVVYGSATRNPEIRGVVLVDFERSEILKQVPVLQFNLHY